jgi:DNA-binding MarR family transcriptional regulator
MNDLHNVAASAPSASASTGAAEALARLFELSIVLSDVMGQGLVDRGLTRARATVIWQLHHQGPVMQRELSDALGVTPRNVTGLLDGLEAAGFVTRGPHPTDRRATVVSLTERGRRVSAMLHAEQQECASMLFDDIPGADLTAFVTTLDLVLERLRGADFGQIQSAAAHRVDGPSQVAGSAAQSG